MRCGAFFHKVPNRIQPITVRTLSQPVADNITHFPNNGRFIPVKIRHTTPKSRVVFFTACGIVIPNTIRTITRITPWCCPSREIGAAVCPYVPIVVCTVFIDRAGKPRILIRRVIDYEIQLNFQATCMCGGNIGIKITVATIIAFYVIIVGGIITVLRRRFE